MQALYQIDMNGDDSDEAIDLFFTHFKGRDDLKPFFMRLVKGVREYREEIDSLIERFSSNWKLNRMSRVDLNIMRIATYELLYCDDIPYRVSINEAVDMGKKFGSKDSGAFVNGILDSIRIFLKKRD